MGQKSKCFLISLGLVSRDQVDPADPASLLGKAISRAMPLIMTHTRTFVDIVSVVKDEEKHSEKSLHREVWAPNTSDKTQRAENTEYTSGDKRFERQTSKDPPRKEDMPCW